MPIVTNYSLSQTANRNANKDTAFSANHIICGIQIELV
ncbi:hypothetical protein LEP1GSC062_4166 [Leptospira alexanderi serovar Manhao 3 str. L 60]|uniref:Uncharacterized protein n=1 Tax=Leptospira alexanderi serovar Manhao 3 str. L 60 TaxID=1049759 RepID=V6I6T1_9LEPT|nr:hypothetical protein LEP1GSC062_4166 [Leptospira alexanderi serovar Manhao 3 str. L 60]